MSAAPGKAPKYMMEHSVTTCMVRDVLVMDADTPTSEAADRLQNHARDEIIVIKEGKVVGIATHNDILDKVGDTTVYAETTKLKSIMTAKPVIAGSKMKLREALTLMHKTRHPNLPVVSRSGKAMGIIYEDDILKRAQSAMGMIPRYISPPGRAILGNLGFVLQFAGMLLLLPALVATFMGDTQQATGIYLTMVMLLITGFFMNSYGEKARMNLRQASVVVLLSLLLLSLFGTTPYLYIHSQIPEGGSFVDTFASAFFSSAAGFTTGGISLYDTPEELPQSFTFYRSYTQMVGGMSFIYLVLTAFYPSKDLVTMRGFITGRELHLRELFGTITVIFALYVVVVALFLYGLGGGDPLDYFSLSMSTLATGGFVPDSGMVDKMSPAMRAVLMAGMLLGAMPFMFHHALVSKKFRRPKLGREVLAYFAILAGGIMIFWSVADGGIIDAIFGAPGAAGGGVMDAVFYPISASTTAGLQSESIERVNAPGQYVLMVLMFLGGCGFSTAGGIKVFRLFQLAEATLALRNIRNIRHSKRVRRALPAMVIVAAFPGISALCGAYLVAVEGASPETAYFDAVGVVTTGGLSTGAITFDTSPHTKIVLSLLMILGRLEIVALVYALAPHILDRH